MSDALSLSETMLHQLLSGQQAMAERVAELSATVNQLSARLDRLDERLTKLSGGIHTPPCRRLEEAERRIEMLEDWRKEKTNEAKATKTRFGNLFWSLLTNAIIAGVSVAATMLWLGYKQMVNQ